MHGVFFPNTEFRSSFGEPVPEHNSETMLCGNKAPSATRTELAFLWAVRVPDAAAPEIALNKTESLPINGKAALGVKASRRAQDWKLTSEDGKLSAPITVKFNATAKTLELTPDDPKLTPGKWKLTGQRDWSPLTVTGKIQLRPDDKFAQPATLPFHLQVNTLETQLDPKSLGPGQYRFLIAQSDGKEHEVPFKVLPAAPEITNLPLTVNTGEQAEEFRLKGTGLDRIEGLSADRATLTLGNGAKVSIRLEPSVRPGERIALQMKIRDSPGSPCAPASCRPGLSSSSRRAQASSRSTRPPSADRAARSWPKRSRRMLARPSQETSAPSSACQRSRRSRSAIGRLARTAAKKHCKSRYLGQRPRRMPRSMSGCAAKPPGG
jgi:hypothetical protein